MLTHRIDCDLDYSTADDIWTAQIRVAEFSDGKQRGGTLVHNLKSDKGEKRSRFLLTVRKRTVEIIDQQWV